MAVAYTLAGSRDGIGRIGWARKADALAHVRPHPGGCVSRVDFGRLHGVQWVGLLGIGERVEILTHDGRRVSAVRGWDAAERRHKISILEEE